MGNKTDFSGLSRAGRVVNRRYHICYRGGEMTGRGEGISMARQKLTAVETMDSVRIILMKTPCNGWQSA